MHPRDYSNISRLRHIQRSPQSESLEGLDIDSFCLGDTICWASFLTAFLETPVKDQGFDFLAEILETEN